VWRRFLLLPCLLLLSGALAPTAQAAPGLTLGFSSDPVLFSGSAATQATWLHRAASDGAGLVAVDIAWINVAPATRPVGFDPANPGSPGYNWTSVDDQVRGLAGRGLNVVLNVAFAPAWAEGGGRPAAAATGTWKPDAIQFKAFATAVARRYSGRFPDPLRAGSFLPRVRDYQAWNEPNLDNYLTPQWVRTHGRWAPESPTIYRKLLNGFYAGIKRVSKSDLVIGGVTAPYGDPPGGHRMPPVAFFRSMFCLRNNALLTPVKCSDPPHLDALDHHPYGTGGPFQRAYNPDDVAVPDIYKLARVLHAARRVGHALPRGPKRLWVTEISWDSSPPDPHGVPIEQQARWLEQSLYVLWHQGVDTVLWLKLVDQAPIPSYPATYQAGLYYLTGQAKPAATAFRFPFVTQRVDRSRLMIWGRSPSTGRLSIQARRRGGWTTLRTARVRRWKVFDLKLPERGRAILRAQVGGQATLPWTQR
jgi:hypothetical protein